MEDILPGRVVQEMEMTEEGFLLEHYLPSSGITLLHGKFSTYKTPLTIHIAKAICTGEELWGLKTLKNPPVLYVEADTPMSVIVPRMKAIGVGVDGLDIAFAYPGVDVVNPTSGERSGLVYEMLRAAHREKKYKLVVIDSLRCIHRLKSIEDDAPPIVYGALSKLFEGAVLAIIHHDKKTKLLERGQRASEHDLEELSAEAFSGSQAWINHATVGVHVKANGKDDSIMLVHTKSQAGEKQPPLHLYMTSGGATAEPPDSRVDQPLEDLVRTLKSAGVKLGTIDREVAKFMGCSVRTGRRRRIEILGEEIEPTD